MCQSGDCFIAIQGVLDSTHFFGAWRRDGGLALTAAGFTTIMILGLSPTFYLYFLAICITATKALSGAHNLLKERRLDSAEGSLVREGPYLLCVSVLVRLT